MSRRLGLDLDRVIFDTNAYLKSINGELEPHGTSVQEIFENGSRKDISYLFSELMRRFGHDRATEILFGDTRQFLSPEVAEIADELDWLVVVSVGDGYQERKLDGFPEVEFFPVKDDDEKVRRARERGVTLFIDDKRSVVELMREAGIEAYQALWFLDEEYRKGALDDALEVPGDLRKLLNL